MDRETYKQPSGLIGGKQKKLKKSLPLPEEEASGHWAVRLPQHGVGGRLDSFVFGNKLRVYGKCMNTPKISELFFSPTYWTYRDMFGSPRCFRYHIGLVRELRCCLAKITVPHKDGCYLPGYLASLFIC